MSNLRGLQVGLRHDVRADGRHGRGRLAHNILTMVQGTMLLHLDPPCTAAAARQHRFGSDRIQRAFRGHKAKMASLMVDSDAEDELLDDPVALSLQRPEIVRAGPASALRLRAWRPTRTVSALDTSSSPRRATLVVARA